MTTSGWRCPRHGARLGGEVHERAEEGPEADAAAAQPGHLGDLLLGQREARENRVGVIGEQLSGLRGMHALAGAPHQLGTDLALEQGDLPETAGWVSASSRPAAEKEPSATTARRVASLARSRRGHALS